MSPERTATVQVILLPCSVVVCSYRSLTLAHLGLRCVSRVVLDCDVTNATVLTINETPRLYVVGLRSAFLCVCVTCCGGDGSYSALAIGCVGARVDIALARVRCLDSYSPVVTICTTSLTFNNSTFCPLNVFMCFVWISEQTAIISLYNIN